MADEAQPTALESNEAAASALRAILTGAAPAAKPKPAKAAEAVIEGDTATSTQADAEVGDGQPEGQETEGAQEDSTDAEQAQEQPDGPVSLEDLAKSRGVEADKLLDLVTTTVKVNGKAETVTLREALNGYTREADYSREKGKLAEDRKSFDSTRQQTEKAARDQTAVLAQTFTHLHGQLVAKAPDPALEQTDPDEYQRQFTRHVASRERFARMVGPVAKVIQDNQAKANTDLETFKNAQREELRRTLPVIFDSTEGPKVTQRLAAFLTKEGMTEQDISTLYYAPGYRVAYKAMLYDEAQSGKALEAKKVKTQARTLRPGAASDGKEPVRALVQQASAQLKKSGGVEDAAKALGAMRRAAKK